MRSIGSILAALAVLLAFTACSDQEFTVNLDQPLRVLALEPGGEATGVHIDAALQVSFSEAVKPGSVNAGTVYLEALDPAGAGTKVDAAIAYDAATFTATLQPAAPLAYSVRHRLVVTTGIERVRVPAASLPQRVEVVFTTEHPPAFRLVGLLPGAGTNAAAIDAPIVATFSEPIDEATVTAESFRVEDADSGSAIAGDLASDGAVVTFVPAAPFGYSREVRVILGTALASTRATDDGGHLEHDLTLTFGTVDPAPLAVISADPGDGTDDFARDRTFSVRFSEPLDPASATAQTVRFEDVTDPAAPVALQPEDPANYLTFSEGNARITFDPAVELGFTRLVRVTLAGSIEPAAPALRSARATDDGGSLPAPITWEVKTIDPPQLRIINAIPGAGSVGAPIEGAVAITFSEPIVDFTADPVGSALVENVADPLVPVAVDGVWTLSGDGQTATFDPFVDLAYATTYRVTLTERIRSQRATDEGGFLLGTTDWTFTTEPPPALGLVAHVPSADSGGIARLTTAGTPQPIVLTFGEPVDPTTVADNVVVSDHFGDAVAGSVTVDGAHVTFEPALAFAYSAQYRVTLLPAITSVRGGPMENGFVFVFDTLDPPPLQVVATLPSGGAAGIERTQPVVLTFSEGIDQALVASSIEVFDVTSGATIAGTFDFGGIGDESGNLDLAGVDVTATFRPTAPDAAWPDVLWPYSRRIGVRIAATLGSDRATDGSANPTGHRGGWLEGGHEIDFRLIDPPALLVGDRMPGAGDVQVARGQPLVLTLTEGVEQASVVLYDGTNGAAATLRVTDADTGLPIAGTLAFNAADEAVHAEGRGADTQLTFTPDGGLWGWSQDVQVQLSTAIRSDRATLYEGVEHGHLADPTLTWSFHAEDPPELLIVSTDPGASEMNVAPDAAVVVTFNEVLDPASVHAASFLVEEVTGGGATPVAGSFSFDGGGASVIFTPAVELPLASRIRVTLTTAICSAIATSDRGCLAQDVSWHFDVVPVPRLQVVSTAPGDGAQLVPITTGLSITFNLDVLQNSIDPAVNAGVVRIEDVTDPANPRPVDITLVSYDGQDKTGWFAISDPLGPNAGQLAPLTPYRVTVRGGATGVLTGAGGELLLDYVFDFATGSNNLVFGTRPAAGAADVDIGTPICAIFNASVIESTVDSTSFALTFVDAFGRTQAVPVAGFDFNVVDPITFALIDANPATDTANEVCFLPDAGAWDCHEDLRTLLYEQGYSVTLVSTIQTSAGPLVGGHTWSFTTGAPPLIEAVTAANDVVTVASLAGAIEVPIDASFAITFAAPMNPATIHGASVMLHALPGDVQVPATVTLAADGRTALLTPDALLGYAATWELRAHGGMTGPTDLDGNYLESDVSWRFSTSPATQLLVSVPQGGSNAVNSIVVAELSRAIHPPSLSPATLFVTAGGNRVPGLTAPREDYRGVAFIPSVELLGNTTHEIHVTTGLRDHRGNPMPAASPLPLGGIAGDAFVGSFSTSNGNDPNSPSLSSSTPGNGGVLAGGGRAIVLNFSEAMNMASFTAGSDAANASAHLVDDLGNRITASFRALSSTSVEMQPDSFLRNGRSYTVTLDREISDAARNSLNATAFSFTVEGIAPASSGMVPANGAVGVLGDAVLAASFSEQMDPDSINAATFTLTCDGAPVAGVITVAADGRSAAFDPAAPLLAAASCTARLDGPTDAAGNALPIATSTFTVVSGPVAVALSPATGSTVAVGTSLVADFGRAIDPATLVPSSTTGAGTVRLVDTAAGSEVFGCMEIDPADPSVVTFHPVEALTAGATYELQVTAGVTDWAGNASDVVSTIFTIAP
ncbi:Ig-like domain-containing protein [Vulgatibacter sp.]|uniref:Ig-like domain-containing protein n=1 Tax=Vulgatibacter sp. TaxID=1971226 RepID=UPI00356419C6